MDNVKQLEKLIVDAQKAYYNKKPVMSDIEFDALVDRLTELDPDSPVLKAVGADHTDGFVKVKHKIIMGSQNKANTAEEMDTWFDKCREHGSEFVIASEKLDGCSIELSTTVAVTRTGLPEGTVPKATSYR